jgi:putative Mg2+ transporter-C (MgtC) family protein
MVDMMPLHPTVLDIALRLLLTLVACGLIGLDREVRGHPAGLRTTVLVGLAASVAMIQANILLSVGGKTADSFGVMDLMRLPLGILTGVGFIGGGAILRYGGSVRGVTTAATLWIVTVIGLCIGGGQIWLGLAATVLGLATLWLLKVIDLRIPREHTARLQIEMEDAAPGDPRSLVPAGYGPRLVRKAQSERGHDLITLEVRWYGPARMDPPAELMQCIRKPCRLRSFEVIEGNH